MEPIAAISSIDLTPAVPHVGAVDVAPPDAVSAPPAATHAGTCTGFDRYPCILDPAAASIAAAAAAQDFRMFQLSQLRLRRPDERR